MYTILVRPNDTLIATNKETIMHRSSLVRQLRFLVDPLLQVGENTLNMSAFACILEYKLPISDKYTPVILTPSEELYEGRLEYILDVDTKITSEVGDVELQLLWTKPEMLASGSFKDYVRVTDSIAITVLRVNQWSDYIASSDLSNIANMVLANQAQAEQLNLLGNYLMMNKADNLTYDNQTNKLQLESMGKPIGDAVELTGCECDENDSSGGGSESGFPTIDFDNPTNDGSGDVAEDNNQFDVVLF